MTEPNTAQNHYTLLRVKPTASPQEIRRAYRDLSKLYHPDTTTLPAEVATEKFKILNDAYATLSNPEQRLAYDYSIGISKYAVVQAPSYLNRPASERRQYEKSSAYLDPTDRPLSPGELFALFILGVTFVGCLILVFAIGWTKGEIVLHPNPVETANFEQIIAPDPEPTAPDGPAADPDAVNAPEPIAPQKTAIPSAPPSSFTESQPSQPLPLDNLSPKII